MPKAKTRKDQQHHAPPCPSCGHRHSKVARTVSTPTGVRRKRDCEGCGERFTSVELTKFPLPVAGGATGIAELVNCARSQLPPPPSGFTINFGEPKCS